MEVLWLRIVIKEGLERRKRNWAGNKEKWKKFPVHMKTIYNTITFTQFHEIINPHLYLILHKHICIYHIWNFKNLNYFVIKKNKKRKPPDHVRP